MNIQDAIKALVVGRSLSEDQAASVIEEIVSGRATSAQIGGLMVALRMKGETIEEITGFVRAARAAATPLPVKNAEHLIDTCGTGGDGSGTFNVSTVAAFVCAGAGVCVAKHGNRSNTSRSGSADLLEALSVDIHMPPEKAAACIDEIGIGFLFAPDYHPGARHALGPRKEIGIRTIFNAMGPLVNPSGCRRQLMGVYDAKLTEPIAQALGKLGSTHVLVVHGDDGLDEISTAAPTRVTELRDGTVRTYAITPEDFGLRRTSLNELAGGDPKYNASIAMDVLNEEKGPRRDIVVLNAGAGIYVGGKAATIAEGVKRAAEAIDSGAALAKLNALIARSRA